MMRYRDIYIKAIQTWGEKAQHDQAVEECAELIAALQHFARGKVDKGVVVDELADVYLMVGQLVYMFGEERVNEAIEKKVARLQVLLEDSRTLKPS